MLPLSLIYCPLLAQLQDFIAAADDEVIITSNVKYLTHVTQTRGDAEMRQGSLEVRGIYAHVLTIKHLTICQKQSNVARCLPSPKVFVGGIPLPRINGISIPRVSLSPLDNHTLCVVHCFLASSNYPIYRALRFG
ncbi:LOW QUALITY PROTEIN: hypothetical protein CVT26_016020 [Gymnopilus dilepis]|uniref:Uncharacterized protein n=1 Tax=Gymnopilus dilepis TaxID=231916 RepID=A0A409YDH2_9AGAR|nr:LOW QUALITY PROTEIN: hypothetical protein CVT26_016020 [Gymnopilus dilepis]